MNKFPLDDIGLSNIFRDLQEHDKKQRIVVQDLIGYCQLLLDCRGDDSDYWEEVQEIKDYLKSLEDHRKEFVNLRFDQGNGHRLDELGIAPGVQVQATSEYKFNDVEGGFGEPMSEEELAKHFNEPPPKKKKAGKDISAMSLEEIEEWEAKQDNSNDIYKISARVKNLAREGGANLTPVGEMLCNTVVHVLKDLYDFADKIQDKETKIKLIEKIRTHEGMPGNFVAATAANVREGKKR